MAFQVTANSLVRIRSLREIRQKRREHLLAGFEERSVDEVQASDGTYVSCTYVLVKGGHSIHLTWSR